MKILLLYFARFFVLLLNVDADCRDNAGCNDENSLTNKIAAWGSIVARFLKTDFPALKVDNAIARPDGLGTGNAHRGGTTIQYCPI